MWVDRRVAYVKPGRMGEAVALLKQWGEALEGLGIEGWSFRLLRPRTGKEAAFILVAEMEFENLEEFDSARAESGASPESKAGLENWLEMNQSRTIHELYHVVE